MRTAEVDAILARAETLAAGWGHAGPAIEHVLLATLEDVEGREILRAAGANVELLLRNLGPLVRFLLVPVRPDLAPWLEAVEQLTTRRGSGTLTTGALLAEIMAATQSAAVAQIVQDGVRRVDVLNVVVHGITKVVGTSKVPSARLLGGTRGARTAGRYRVIMHNDNYTPYEVAVDILISRFGKSRSDAVELAKRIDADGQAIVGVYSLRAASKRVDRATDAAHRVSCPLRFSFEPDER